MAGQKTKPTNASVEAFLSALPDEQVQQDCRELVKMMQKITGEPPVLWGNIVGFGKYHYQYDSGHQGYSCLTGFAPRKQNISLYVMGGMLEEQDLLKKLGKHKAGKGCLYVKKLSDVDVKVLEQIIKKSVDYLKKKYPNK
jgi:hypothetical protein